MRKTREGLPRILFDTNDGTAERGYELKFTQSLEDIAAIGQQIHEGMQVVIYMPEELEFIATLKFDREAGWWLGVPIAGTIKYLDGTDA